MKKYKTYMYRGTQDPIVGEVLKVIEVYHTSDVSRDSGVSKSTIRNWKTKKTSRPQHATLAAAIGFAGMEFTISKKGR